MKRLCRKVFTFDHLITPTLFLYVDASPKKKLSKETRKST